MTDSGLGRMFRLVRGRFRVRFWVQVWVRFWGGSGDSCGCEFGDSCGCEFGDSCGFRGGCCAKELSERGCSRGRRCQLDRFCDFFVGHGANSRCTRMAKVHGELELCRESRTITRLAFCILQLTCGLQRQPWRRSGSRGAPSDRGWFQSMARYCADASSREPPLSCAPGKRQRQWESR
jgi:hypothetical protein